MLHSWRIKAVQSGLRHHHRPLGMLAARLLQGVQHDVLNRVGYLHHDQHQMRLLLTPGDVACRIIARLAEPTRIEKPQQRRLGRHVVERRGSRARFKAQADLGARVARERRDDRGLASAGLAQQPYDQCCGLNALACVFGAGGDRPEQRLLDRVPELVRKPDEVPQTAHCIAESCQGVSPIMDAVRR
jgi:hypothetical protein